MADTETLSTHALITDAYTAFNRRDSNAALALMTESVSWPKASEGGHVVGKDEIRAYWTRQWADFDPNVTPLEITTDPAGLVHVRVHQLVKSLHGNVLSDSEVVHIFTLANGLITRMDLQDSGADSGASPSAAFARH